MVTILGKEDFSKGVKGVGQPMQGVLMRLDKDNRICLKCPGLVVNAKNSCAADQDWFVTSDIGKEDNGYWEIIHRMDRVINTGGEKVIPDLVEKKILEFPAVKSCLVSPINDIKWGQRVVAYITPKSVNKEKLLEFLKSSLSSYEIPKELFTVENLETTEEGGWKR
jgi:acyl-CoA synthetase (AMP-forming)/AMP-acid ligase II